YRDLGQYEKAIADYDQAIQLRKDLPEPWYNRGNVYAFTWALLAYEPAIADFKQAILLKPDYAEAHCNLGVVLAFRGQFHEALAALRRGHDLGAKIKNWKHLAPFARWIKRCERLIELDAKLPAVLDGKEAPKGAGEQTEFAEVCAYKQLHAAAARFYEQAF